MREQALLAHIAATTRPHPAVAVGPGDDCAVVAGHASLLVTTDQLIQGRHYRPGESPARIAAKAVNRSLSDIAAMGGTPVWAVATGAIPSGTTDAYARELTDAIHAAAAHAGCPVVGGDIATTTGPMVLTVTVAGIPHPRRGPVLRSTARAGDDVYVTGALGGSLSSGRHMTFAPRLAEAAWLCGLLHNSLHAMMDISDGLGIDAARVAEASGVAIHLQADRIPCHEHVATWQQAAGDGEDYELLLTVASGTPIPDRCPWTGTAVTWVGHVVPFGGGPRCVIRTPAGEVVDASAMGWEHRA